MGGCLYLHFYWGNFAGKPYTCVPSRLMESRISSSVSFKINVRVAAAAGSTNTAIRIISAIS